MKRQELIEILIEDRINEWVHAKCPEELEWILEEGWKGYGNYTTQQLQEKFMELTENNFDKETAEKIIIEKKEIEKAIKTVKPIMLAIKPNNMGTHERCILCGQWERARIPYDIFIANSFIYVCDNCAKREDENLFLMLENWYKTDREINF